MLIVRPNEGLGHKLTSSKLDLTDTQIQQSKTAQFYNCDLNENKDYLIQ